MSAETIVARARACIGARFRPQGRDPALGLDCVGLAALAFARSLPPARYALRGNSEAAIRRAVEGQGLVRAHASGTGVSSLLPGDLLLVRCGAAQLHLVVLTRDGFVHADAGLRRVVETPDDPPWPILAAWREPERK